MNAIGKWAVVAAGLASGVLFGLVAAAAQAAPAAGLTGLGASTETVLTQVDYKECWWRNGERHCRWVSDDDEEPRVYRKYRNSSGDVGSRRPEEFETGSSQWWQAMDRQGRGGFGRN